MWRFGWSDSEALEHVKQCKGFIDPNIGFVGQLIGLQARFKSQQADSETQHQAEPLEQLYLFQKLADMTHKPPKVDRTYSY